MAHDVASKLNQSTGQNAINTYTMGEELRWLVQVIPPAAQGNWKLTTSGTQDRLYLRQLWPLYKQMIDIDPEIKLFMDNLITSVRPALNTL